MACRQDDVAEMLAPVRARRQAAPGAARNPPPPAAAGAAAPAGKVGGKPASALCSQAGLDNNAIGPDLLRSACRLLRGCRSVWHRP